MTAEQLVEYHCARRREIAGLLTQLARGEKVLFSDGRYRVAAKTRQDTLLHEYVRSGDAMQAPLEDDEGPASAD